MSWTATCSSFCRQVMPRRSPSVTRCICLARLFDWRRRSFQLFFSRQTGINPITGQEVPINGGAKITGTLDGFEVGVMDVDTRFSGPNPWANYGEVRNTGSECEEPTRPQECSSVHEHGDHFNW